MTAAPHVLGDLLGGPDGELGEAGVELPEQLLLLATVRGDLVRRPREVCRRLEEPEPRVRGGRPVVGGRRDTDGGTTDLSAAMYAGRRVETIECVDEAEGRLERAARAVQVEVDGLVAEGIQGHDRRGRLGREPLIQPARDQHDPALEQLLLQPGGEMAPTRKLVGDTAPHAHFCCSRKRAVRTTRPAFLPPPAAPPRGLSAERSRTATRATPSPGRAASRTSVASSQATRRPFPGSVPRCRSRSLGWNHDTSTPPAR